ncbi:MAG: hypothetical protein CNCCGFBP_00837 [Fimbriimonadaceae bacterium]|nr:hypothetical protein [Fimbriimonadaceae bacterium]
MSFVALCLADIGYKVKALPEQQRLEVTMTVPVTSSTTALQVPSWSPGAYVLRDFASGIKDIRFTSEAGKELAFIKPEAFTWNVDTANVKALTATYWVANNPADGAMHYSGPPTYLYVVDRKTEPCLLTFDLPHGWLAVLGIDERRDGSYRAEDYDVLADNPVTMGDFLMDSYSARGKPHYIVYRGRLKQHIDREFVMRMCRQVTESQAEFFGGLPYSKYVWHFSVSPAMSGGGGLEHLSSTQIGLAVGVGPSTMYLCAHEFFHLWNVKRIRSYLLGPFDYTQLPKTGALWWLEGVTDYYASLLPTRTGWFGRDEFYRQVESNVNRTRSNEERLKVSPFDASYRVGEANNGRGNSSGFGVNYYNTGWLLGLCLDIELRTATSGKRSLDDVMRALYDQCKDGRPGFEEESIRRELVRFGGEKLGEAYDKWVMQPGELPVERQLEKMGLSMRLRMARDPDFGFSWTIDDPSAGLRLTSVDLSRAEVLKAGEQVVEIAGVSMRSATIRSLRDLASQVLARQQVGTELSIVVKGEDGLRPVRMMLGSKVAERLRVEPAPYSNPVMRRLRDAWLGPAREKTEAVGSLARLELREAA